jgi:hypothetical protein
MSDMRRREFITLRGGRVATRGKRAAAGSTSRRIRQCRIV